MSIVLNFFGDFCPIGRMDAVKPADNSWLGDVADWVKAADLNIFDLECPLTDHSNRLFKSGPHLKANPDRISLIKNAGFGVATLANNHILDYGAEGLLDTINILEQNQISYVGASASPEKCKNPLRINVKGKKIGLVNFTHTEFSTADSGHIGANGLDIIDNYAQIMDVKTDCDYVFVIIHAGIEMYKYPSPKLQKMCKFFASLKVTAVICHHSHVVCGYEVYGGIPIFYGLGNFILDFPGKPVEFRKGLSVRFNMFEDDVSYNWLAFEYESTGELTLKKCQDFNLLEISQQDVCEQWEKLIKDPARIRSTINTMRGTRKLERLINKFQPQQVWKGIGPPTLLMLRNEFSYEYLISVLDKQFRNSESNGSGSKT